MTPFVNAVSHLIGISVIFSQILILAILYVLLIRDQKVIDFINRYGISASILVSIFAIAGSFFYSEIARFPPCELCWIQRSIMLPQFFLLLYAYFKESRGLFDLILVLLGGGILISGYQSLLQMNLVPGVCDVTSVSCSEINVLEFGYVTIPMMSLTAFTLLFLLVLISKRKRS